MSWFLADQAAEDLTKLSSDEWKRKYANKRQEDGSYRFGNEPANGEETPKESGGFFNW